MFWSTSSVVEEYFCSKAEPFSVERSLRARFLEFLLWVEKISSFRLDGRARAEVVVWGFEWARRALRVEVKARLEEDVVDSGLESLEGREP